MICLTSLTSINSIKKEQSEDCSFFDFWCSLPLSIIIDSHRGSYYFFARGAYKISIACPVVCEGEAIGSVVIFFNDDIKKLGETEEKVAQTSAAVLSKMIAEC